MSHVDVDISISSILKVLKYLFFSTGMDGMLNVFGSSNCSFDLLFHFETLKSSIAMTSSVTSSLSVLILSNNFLPFIPKSLTSFKR